MLDRSAGLLGHGHGPRRIVVFTEGIPQPVVEVVDRLTQVSLGPTPLEDLRPLEPVSDST
jgi:hypothetical protein